jgi:glycosyltransferase involved in cell wall biosynthesis
VPALPGHPVLTLPAERLDDLLLLLRSMAVSRVHIHHMAGIDMDIRRLVHRLGVPFDVTVHDYYAICPRVNFLPWPDSPYCGEPDQAGCNACIGARPSSDAHDILVWRAERSWQFLEADRVLCPSQDALIRLRRYGLDAKAVLALHEPVAAEPWPQRVVSPGGGKLRIAVLGVLADHKGARTVAAVAEAVDPKSVELHLIGRTEHNFPKSALKRLKITGEYDDTDLPKLIAKAAPHVIWFPTVSSETYSYTLTTAIGSGIPIVATEIGAFTERLAGRPFTWLARGHVSAEDWIGFFDTVRTMLENATMSPPPHRAGIADFYQSEYLRPAETAATMIPAPIPVRIRASPAHPSIAVVPERHESNIPTPCAYIRLLQPLDHPAIGGDFRVVLADAKTVLEYDVDVIVTQRHALPTIEAAEAVIAHARRVGAALVYDLDDDLLNIPPNHPEAAELRPRTRIVSQMLRQSDVVWLSTERLAESVSPIRPDATVIGNSLYERIWAGLPVIEPFRDEPVRILCMGTSTHNRDFALIEPVLARLKEEYGDRVEIDIVGMTTQDRIAPGLNRIGAPSGAGQSYPGFVNWLRSVQPRWHIGLAPLLDVPFNRVKSAIKTMDYAALGLLILASDVPAYRGSLADGVAGRLVPNDHRAWYAALDEMVRNQDLRRSIAAAARPAFLERATLASQAAKRREAWASLAGRPTMGTPPYPPIAH